jgi:pimeloyl-ACP methyl ester carboxylesterase
VAVPLLIVPGLVESADDYLDVVDFLRRRRVIALTFRGRGKNILNRRPFCLFASSRGVSYGLAYALDHSERLAGLVLADYPARHFAMAVDFPDRFLATVWRGKPASDCIASHVKLAIAVVRGLGFDDERQARIPHRPTRAAGRHGHACAGGSSEYSTGWQKRRYLLVDAATRP